MPKGDLLGVFEQCVLLALIRSGDNAYGMNIRQEIEKLTNRPTSLGAVYATLDRLESKGYIASTEGPANRQRGGRARRFFRIEPPGLQALQETHRVIDEMYQEVGPVQFPKGSSVPLPDRGIS
jgi:DNA-binding PadR family transcriptional regulator